MFNVLFIRLSVIGDIVMVLGLLLSIKYVMLNVKVIWLVELVYVEMMCYYL